MVPLMNIPAIVGGLFGRRRDPSLIEIGSSTSVPRELAPWKVYVASTVVAAVVGVIYVITLIYVSDLIHK